MWGFAAGHKQTDRRKTVLPAQISSQFEGHERSQAVPEQGKGHVKARTESLNKRSHEWFQARERRLSESILTPG